MHTQRGFSLIPVLFVLIAVGLGISVGYALWANYQNTKMDQGENINTAFCTEEAKLCPDGSYVGRTGPNCEFEECAEEITCGTIAGLECPSGYECEYESSEVDDAAGICKVVTLTDETSPELLENAETKTYRSENFGLEFTYASPLYLDEVIVEETDDTLYLYQDGNERDSGQWVRKFSKEIDATLTETIQLGFLDGYASSDCFVETSFESAPSLGDEWSFARIRYSIDESDSDSWWKNAEKCPNTYTTSGGLSYFAMNSSNPGVFYFFQIGNGIVFPASEENPDKGWWEEIVKLRSSNNIFSFDDIEIGDRVGNMIVANKGKFNENIEIEDRLNRKVSFSGRTTITGRLTNLFSEFGGGYKACMQNLSDTSLGVIPRMEGDTRNVWFCFTNYEDVNEAYPQGYDGEATVRIDEYAINLYPSEVFNTARFVASQ